MTNGKMMSAFCQKCQEIFTLPSRRGRPPRFCDKCLGLAKSEAKASEELQLRIAANAEEIRREKAKADSIERVDRLEAQLKMFGRHISQHRHKWE